MATKRMCPHRITLFNFLGEDQEGNAQFSSVLLMNVHVNRKDGVNATNSAADAPHVHIFDDLAESSPEKTFLPFDEWKALSGERDQYWTLNPEGGDYFAVGDHRTADGRLPDGVAVYKIINVARRDVGKSRMWHWRIEGR